jgi:ubiquinone/menaquinone biosynthesis C-methylase UbiE
MLGAAGLATAFTGRFLDVGTGVGAMVLEAVKQFPSLQVVGLDIWGTIFGLGPGQRRRQSVCSAC